MQINEQIKLPLNGTEQYVSIRAEQADLPLLLYLHGGPGDAALPLVLKYNRALENHFTVVVWEQRGAGKSYYDFGDSIVTIDTFLQDLHSLVMYLTERYQQKKLFLLGHSWGSVLGLTYAADHPEMLNAYIGCGQVVNMKKACRIAYEYAVAHASPKALKRLTHIDYTYTGENWLDDLLFVTGQVVKHGGSLYGRSNYNDLIKPFLFSKYYSIPDLIRRQKGSLQSIKRLWPELMETNFERKTEYGVPIIFVEGKHDAHVSSELANEYFNTIKTESHFFYFTNSCHFPQWSESDRFNNLLINFLTSGYSSYAGSNQTYH